MAFNPFHAFRKHQKTLFAGLTIVCMLTFVMSSGVGGAGDFFSEVSRYLGGRGKFQQVATLYGHNVDARDIQLLRNQRTLANQYIQTAVFMAHNNIATDVQTSMSKFDERAQSELQQLMSTRQISLMIGQTDEYLRRLPQFALQLDILRNSLVEAKKPEAVKIERLQKVIEQEAWLFRRVKDDLYPGSNLYFGGSTTAEGLLDFMIWRHEADRLGIVLTNEDIRRAVHHEALDSLSEKEWRIIDASPEMGRLSSPQMLFQALGDEFRVRLAQAALVGYDPGGFPRVPAPVTPHELWGYYRTNRTEVNVKLLPVPVSKFLAAVKEKPSDADLQALYDKFKDVEPAPDHDTPGFKQPQRIKVEWIQAVATADYYRKATQVVIGLTQATTPAAWDALLLKEYQEGRSFLYRIPSWSDFGVGTSFFTYNSVTRPEFAAGTVAQVLGAAGTHGSPLLAVIGPQSRAAVREARKLADVAAQAVFAGPQGPAPFVSAGVVMNYPGARERYLSMDEVRDQLVEKIETSTARNLVSNSLDAFKKELTKLRGKPADAEKLVQKEVTAHQWKHDAATQWDDQYSIGADPKLTPLRDAYLHRPGTNDPKGRNFGRLFFQRGGESSRLYTPNDFQDVDQGDFVYWRTAEQAAQVLTLDVARPQVLKAWETEKARELAVKDAKNIIEEAKKTKGDPIPVLNEAAKRLGQETMDLFGIARLRPSFNVREGFGSQYVPYMVPEDKIEYPEPDFADQVLELKQTGDLTVVSDRPKNNYYVVALTLRQEPTLTEPSLRQFVKDMTPSMFSRQSILLERFEDEQRHDYRLKCLRQLQAAARLSKNPDGLRAVDEKGSSPGEEE